jgi:hypothetical protein
MIVTIFGSAPDEVAVLMLSVFGCKLLSAFVLRLFRGSSCQIRHASFAYYLAVVKIDDSRQYSQLNLWQS